MSLAESMEVSVQATSRSSGPPASFPTVAVARFGAGVTPGAAALAFGILLVPGAGTRAQTVVPSAEETAAWEPIRFLEGTWEAEISGSLGTGRGRRTYEEVFDGLYTLSKHASVRLPQAESPEGDHHRELGVYSYDRVRGTIVLREFMVEGYVVRSTCDTSSRRFVCTTEAVESGPGIRARLTVEISDPFRFVETYELDFPGRETSVHLTNTWTRVPDLGAR